MATTKPDDMPKDETFESQQQDADEFHLVAQEADEEDSKKHDSPGTASSSPKAPGDEGKAAEDKTFESQQQDGAQEEESKKHDSQGIASSSPKAPGGPQPNHPFYFPAVPGYHHMMVPMPGYAMMQHYAPINQNGAAPLDYSFTGQKPLGLGSGGYTDASMICDPAPDTRRNRGGVTEPFPEKLHKMLEETEKEGLNDVVGWFVHGRAFSISKPRRFCEEIMPRFFKQSRLTSFQRQLNLYGFRRIYQGPDNGGYYHELFLKGRPGLCVNMKRTKVKGTTKKKTSPGSEPNFYAYPPIKSTNPVNGNPYAPAFPSPQRQNKIGSPPTSPGTPLQAFPSPYYPLPQMQPMPPLAGPYTAAQQPASPPEFYHPYHYNFPGTPSGEGSPVSLTKTKAEKRETSESPTKV